MILIKMDMLVHFYGGMEIVKYIFEMPEEYQCLLVTYRDRESVCVHEDAMDRVTFRDNCNGNMENRPDWCPLVEVKDEVERFYPSELAYKGYKGRIIGEDTVIRGVVTNISDVITFRGMNIDDAVTEFEKSVDDYLEYCKEKGLEPNKPRD